MKLKTKLSLTAAVLFLILSQIFSVWNLFCSQEQMIGNICDSEGQKTGQDADDFRKKLQKYSLGEENLWRIWARMCFIDGYSTNAALYYGTEELANQTPYRFLTENIESSRDTNVTVYRQEIGGRQLVVTCGVVTSEWSEKLFLIRFRDVTEVYEEIRSLFLKGIFVSLGLCALLLLLLNWMTGRILKPFYQMKTTANVIAEGNYGERILSPGKDEVGEVARSFNRMADHVEEHITMLAEMNEKQRQLLGALSHELKTPMTGIQGYAELLQRVELSPKRQADALRYIEEECKRLSRLSVKMLQIVELSGEETIEKKELSVEGLLKQAEKITKKNFAQKKQKLTVEAFAGIMVQGDRDLLLSLITNLLDNARKASPDGSEIRLWTDETGMFVEDKGCGIPEEEIARITEPFYMVDKSRSRKAGGAGLGLALCSQIARLHGWRLEIVSEVGKGSRIGVRWDEI